MYGWKASLIAFVRENVLIYNYSFGKTNTREIGSRNTLEERMDKVSGISDIHHFYDRMDAGGRSEIHRRDLEKSL